MTQTEAAYFAGLFDGEGSVIIYRRKSFASVKGCTMPHHLRVTLSNTNEAAVRWCAKKIGGSVHEYTPVNQRKRAWKWTAYGPTALPALQAALPFMIIKQEQTALAIEFQQRVSTFWRGRRHGIRGQLPIPQNEIDWREAIRLQLSQLR